MIEIIINTKSNEMIQNYLDIRYRIWMNGQLLELKTKN